MNIGSTSLFEFHVFSKKNGNAKEKPCAASIAKYRVNHKKICQGFQSAPLAEPVQKSHPWPKSLKQIPKVGLSFAIESKN